MLRMVENWLTSIRNLLNDGEEYRGDNQDGIDLSRTEFVTSSSYLYISGPILLGTDEEILRIQGEGKEQSYQQEKITQGSSTQGITGSLRQAEKIIREEKSAEVTPGTFMAERKSSGDSLPGQQNVNHSDQSFYGMFKSAYQWAKSWMPSSRRAYDATPDLESGQRRRERKTPSNRSS